MKIIKDEGLWRKTTKCNYTPTSAELHYYYSGTHAGPNPNNPYIIKRATATTVKFTKVKS